MLGTTLLVTHPDCIMHDPGHGHPEVPGRLSAVLDVFEEPEFSGLIRENAPFGTEEDLARVHDRAFLSAVMARSANQRTCCTGSRHDCFARFGSGCAWSSWRCRGGS